MPAVERTGPMTPRSGHRNCVRHQYVYITLEEDASAGQPGQQNPLAYGKTGDCRRGERDGWGGRCAGRVRPDPRAGRMAVARANEERGGVGVGHRVALERGSGWWRALNERCCPVAPRNSRSGRMLRWSRVGWATWVTAHPKPQRRHESYSPTEGGKPRPRSTSMTEQMSQRSQSHRTDSQSHQRYIRTAE